MSGNRGEDLRQVGDSDRAIPLEDIPLHSTNLLSLLDEEGTIHYQSPSVERLCGFDQADLVGVSCTECFHPDDRERVSDAFEAVVASDDDVVEAIEYRHLTADGTYRWVESVTSSNPTADGYYVINTRDVSARIRRQRKLERANERLKEFANIVSHDLRNPLAVAQGYLELAEKDATTDYNTEIADALARMETLIDSLLTNARVETRGVDLRELDLTSLTESCWQNVPNGDATLHTEVDTHVYADPVHLSQLLENLFRNAVDHGTDDVVVSVGELPDGFYVEDDGAGIPEADREEIFDAGYTTSTDGTGLGLSIVRRVVESHEWSVRAVESSSGGARFEITGVEFVP